jgi:hypothetical protein
MTNYPKNMILLDKILAKEKHPANWRNLIWLAHPTEFKDTTISKERMKDIVWEFQMRTS